MKRIDLPELKEHIQSHLEQAEYILSGDGDGYDGADGARYIKKLCERFQEFITEVEQRDADTKDSEIKTLFDTPHARRTDPPTSHAAAANLAGSGRGKNHKQRILDLFGSGLDVTNVQMAEISLKYTGRISDLRKEGHVIKVVDQNFESGVAWYRYEGKTDGH